jgi:hypothetical protein
VGFVDEFEAMIAAGAGLVVATVCPDGSPRVCRAWSVVAVDRVAGRLRASVTADDAVTVDNLTAGPIALTAANVQTLRSLQVKGRAVAVDLPTEDDLVEAERQTDVFFASVSATDGIPIELLRRIRPRRIVMVELQVDERFDQTPGPSAGAPLGDGVGEVAS